MEFGQAALNVVRRVGSDEAGVCSDVSEGRGRPKHTRDLADDRAEVIQIRMREDRHRAIEARIRKRQRSGVCANHTDALRVRSTQHVLRNVGARHFPTTCDQSGCEASGAAADIDQRADRLPIEQAEEHVPRFALERQRLKLGVVPVRDAVVA
jgi:hypothetical protein